MAGEKDGNAAVAAMGCVNVSVAENRGGGNGDSPQMLLRGAVMSGDDSADDADVGV